MAIQEIINSIKIIFDIIKGLIRNPYVPIEKRNAMELKKTIFPTNLQK